MAARIGFLRSSSWETGFVGQVTIRPDAALAGWTLLFDAGFEIVNIWGAEIVARQDGQYLLRNLAWNGTVAAGGEVTFGFQAVTTEAAAAPANFVLAGPDPAGFPDPPPPVLSVADAAALEGAEAVFVVTLSAASAAPVTVDFATAAGTALAGADFAAAAGRLTFAPGETRKEVRVALTDDAVREGTESFALNLSGATGATIGRAIGTATVTDDDWPRISIADVSVVEPNSGLGGVRFTLTLSAPSAEAVTVRVTTEDGTATAGSDYVARTALVRFAPGETSRVFVVNSLGDTVPELDETFGVRLSAPVGAAIADGEATGTLRNSDRPLVSVADAGPVAEGDPGGAGMVGVLSTRGNQIVDATGAPVRVAAVNWFGMETGTFAPHGLWARNWQEMMREMVEAGFNAIRLPFSGQSILEPGAANGIDFAFNPDLVGLQPIQILDRIVGYAGELGLRIILDHHRSTAGNGPNPNGLWYDGAFTEARWIDMWEALAARYRGNPTVIGADLQNEPHGASWDAWASAAERAGNAIHAVNPDWLILVEGVGSHNGESYWWGGQLAGARERPVQLELGNKLVYSPHDYPNSIFPQSFFYAPDFPNNLPGVFDRMWGYLWREGIAPVLVGEMGTRLQDPRDLAWLEKITAYMSGDLDGNGTQDRSDTGPSFAWWSWNPNSGDTGGILADDWRTVLTAKLDALDPIMPDAAAGAAPVARFEVTLSEAAPFEVTMGWRTVPGTANAADYVAATGTLTFAPGETRQTVEIALRPDTVPEADEVFSLRLFGLQGAAAGDLTGTATIRNDDVL